MRPTSARVALAVVALLVAGFLVPYLLTTFGGGSSGVASVPAGSVTR